MEWTERVVWAIGLISGGVAAAWAWFRSQRKELLTEEEERRKKLKEEQEQELRQRAMPLTTVLAELKADHQKIAEGMARKDEALTNALVRIATTEGRLAQAESRCAVLERENVQCREEQGRQAVELVELRRRLNGLPPGQGGGT